MIATLAILPLGAAAWQDVRSRLISNRYSLCVFVCGIAGVVFGRMSFLAALLGGLAIGGLLFLGAMATGGIGGGDIKLAAAVGTITGTISGLAMLSLALLMLLLYGRLSKATSLPFAPFLFLAYITFLIWS